MTLTKNIKLINAGAGSGKTFKISQKVLEHINKGGSVKEVLVTTFTITAAQELRERIAEDLIEAGKIEEAVKVDDAWIGTVHSLGKRMIDLFTFEAEYAPDQDVIPEEDETFVFGQVMAQAITTKDFAALTALAEELEIPNWQKDIHDLVKKARENNIDLAKHIEFANNSYETFLETVYNPLINYGPHRPDQILELLHSTKSILSRIQSNQFKKHLKTIAAIEPMIESINTVKFNGFEQYKKVWDILKDEIKNNEEREEIFALARGEFQKCYPYYFLSKFQSPLKDSVKDYLTRLFQAASQTYSEYINFKKQRGLMDFSDQENEFLNLLGKDSVQKYALDKFKLMLVDEFQDTNPMQLAIFMKLSRYIDNVFFVGDPKQSIYAFRGADPILTGKIFDRLDKDEPLSTSRRSRHDLVDFSNSIFTKLFNDEDAGLKKWDKLSENAEMNLGPPIQMWPTGDTKNKDQRIKNIVHHLRRIMGVSPPRYIDKASKQIKTAGYGQIAVLCKSNSDVAAWASAFEAAGIEVSAARDDLVSQAEFVFLMAALAFLADQRNTLAITELVLLGDKDFSGNIESLLDQRLEHLQTEEQVWMNQNPILNKLRKIATLLENSGVKDIMEQTVVQLDLYGIAASWGKASVRKANIQKMLKLAEEYEKRCIIWSTAISVHGFIQWIGSQDSLEQQPSGSSNAVTVLTYHKAKGLEWPIVLMDGMNETPKNFWWGSYLKTDYTNFDINKPLDSRSLYYLVNPFGKSFDFMLKKDTHNQPPDFILDNINQSIHVRNKQVLDHAESLRKLYVGITRARDYLIIPSPKELPQNSWWSTTAGQIMPDFFEQEAAFDLDGTTIAVSQIFEAEKDNGVEVILSKYFPSPSGIDTSIEPKMITPSKLENEEDKEQYAENFSVKHQFESGRIPGSFEDRDLGDAVHTMMAAWDSSQTAENRKAQIREISEAFHLESLDTEKWDNRISEFFSWISQQYPGAILHKEIPLRMIQNDQVYAGIADLVIETDQGFILVDHKSYQGTDIIKHSGKFYHQILAYENMLNSSGEKKVLEKHLHFPVTGTLLELNN